MKPSGKVKVLPYTVLPLDLIKAIPFPLKSMAVAEWLFTLLSLLPLTADEDIKKGCDVLYIRDVIERVKTYYPSEYDGSEMYPWCDEVSAMIAIEDKCVYNAVTLRTKGDGTLLLPPYVEFHNIVSVTSGGITLKKSNLKLMGGSTLETGLSGDVEVVYLVPYKPIRAVSYKGTARCEGDIMALQTNPFIKGDTIKLETTDGQRLVTVIDVKFIPDSEYSFGVKVGVGQLEGLTGELDLTLTRQVTEKTLCSAPYDTMYIDYLMGKIALYQRDYQMYNQFMTAFNSRLDAYKRWLINYIPQDGGKLKNWWKGR